MTLNKSEAYNKYFELVTTGTKPAYAIRDIAKEADVSERTVYNWKAKYRWDEKVTERSIKLNKELAKDIEAQADQVVKDYKKPFINILNRLIKQCIHDHEVKIETTKDLVLVMETVVKMQKQLDMNTVNIISSEYSRDKHTKAINNVLKELQQESITQSEKNKMDGERLENGLQKTKDYITG